MTADFRALCAELSGLLDNLHSLICVECPRALDEDSGGDFALDLRIEEALERARAALAEADEPAVPEDTEPAAVTGQPSDEELLRIYGLAKRDYNYEGPIDDWPKRAERAAPVAGLRAVLARWGNHAPAPTADREVAELGAWLEEGAGQYTCLGFEDLAVKCARAAELLLEQALVPVPVAERLPGPEDCDAEGRCWWLVSHQSWPCLYLMKAYIGLDAAGATHWLPAHALPLPEVGE